jgi:hypothetical protein
MNSHVGAGGACAIAPIASTAAPGASRPLRISSIVRIAETTLPCLSRPD